jgi:ribosomal 30S subunit maturation factor RimM
MVTNFEEYMKQQEEAFRKFMKEQEEAFQKFMEEDQKAFEEFKRKDAEDFERFKNYHILKEKIDLEKEKKDEWVRWNMERDKVIEQQRKNMK